MNSTFTKILICFFICVFSAKQINAQCLANETQIVISITTDNYPGETSWQLLDQNGAGFVNANPLTLSSTTYTWSVCVPTSNCYSFTIFDSWGDGICCAWGNGSYSVTYGGAIVASGGSFGSSETTSNIGNCLPPTASSFCDDFESYTNGSWLAASSSDWTTWTQPYTANEDVQITNSLSNSPSNSIYFNGTSSPGGPSDVILPFGSTAPYTSGYFNFSAEFYVINGAYFNFQSEVVAGNVWAFEAEMTTAGVINFTHWNGISSSTLLNNVNYPSNQWFELKMEIDLNSNLWEVFIDGVSQGSFANPTNQIASLDLYPLSGNQFYVDDICYEFSNNPIIFGCTDSTAINYNPSATSDDGSCIYCTSLTATTMIVDESPLGASNGSIDLTVSGSPCSTPLTFAWSNGATTEDISGLTAGTYTVTITDCNSCTFTISATVNAISGPCGPDSTQLVISITTDDYPMETSWYLMDQFGGGWTNVPLTSNDANTTLTWTLCVPDTNCYTFTMLDAYGDGICCAWGSGSYNISYDGIIVGSGGSFAFAQEHCGIGLCTPNCQIIIPSTAISEGEPCGTDVNHGCDDNWKISNFTIQNADDCAWGYLGDFCGPELYPDLFVYMTKNSNYFYYSDYYLDTWYPNSFSMYAGISSPPLEIPTQGLFTSPYVLGQTNTYEFSIGDNDGGFIQTVGWNNNDYLGSYTLPNSLTAGINSITTSTGDADVDYTAVAPTTMYTPLTNNSTIHGNFWAENNIRDTDWYDFTILNDSTIFTLNAISETPFNVMLLDASGGCNNPIVLDSIFALGCDTISITNTLQAGSYWLLTFPTIYSCMSCSDSIDYLLDISWVTNNSFAGCTNPLASNYNPLANIDDGSCIYPFYGCTDSTAVNYNPLANIDDSSCVYCLDGCTDTTACNYDVTATCDDGSCILPDGCTDSLACNYDALATCDDGSCLTVYGCTDSLACNYDSTATCDDGSCAGVLGCTDPLATNYDPAALCDDGSCIACIEGCMDATMFNYNASATCDSTGSLGCIAFVYGCTDATAINYYAGANADDGSCVYVVGCTDATACNYDPLADVDDGSCEWTSCTGTCGAITITGVNMTDVIHDRATFNWDDMNDSSCVVDQIRIRYREAGTSTYSTKTMGAPVGNNAPCVNTSKLVLNLTASTTYEYDFKIWYQDGSNVNWHANGSFTTADLCVNATNMSATSTSNTQADFCWDAPASPWAFVRLQYRENVPGSSFSNIGGFGVMAPALCKTKNGLTPGLQYRVMWRTWCNLTGGPYRSPVWDGPVVWIQPNVIRLAGGTAITNLDIYPNPSRDIFNVTFTSERIQDLKVRILNLIGEELVNEDLQQFIGEYTKQIDLSNNAKGIYFLEIETIDGIINKKLILQ